MGEYEGTLVSWDKYGVLIIDEDGEEQVWQSNHELYMLLHTLDIQKGDRVLVKVEFTNYIATHIVQLDLEPRALLARIEELERLIKGLTT